LQIRKAPTSFRRDAPERALEEQHERLAAREGEAPVLVTSASIRPFVRSLVERFGSQTTVRRRPKSIRARLKTVGSMYLR
jgi:flagellar biosynthesis protein FlhA